MPRIKITKSQASFKGHLQLGNPEEYETAVRIPVERYYRTYVAKPPSASSYVLRADLAGGEGTAESSATATGTQENQPEDGSILTSVRPLRTYQVVDESAPGGKIDVERDDLAKGYEYGRTAVHIDATDENITTLETFAGLELIGFIQSDRVCPQAHYQSCIKLWLITPSMNASCTCPTPISSSDSAPMTRLLLLYLHSSTLFSNWSVTQ